MANLPGTVPIGLNSTFVSNGLPKILAPPKTNRSDKLSKAAALSPYKAAAPTSTSFCTPWATSSSSLSKAPPNILTPNCVTMPPNPASAISFAFGLSFFAILLMGASFLPAIAPAADTARLGMFWATS